MKKIFYLTLLATIMITACQPKTVSIDLKAEADSIRSIEDQWTIALKEKNTDKIMSFYATDGVSMRPNKPILIGFEAIREAQVSIFADTTLLWDTYSGTVDTVEVSDSGDLAYTRGNDRISRKTPNGPVEEAGKWLDVWKKIDGEWKCIVSAGNSNNPLEDK
ncbi:MAG: nuclear transport factor 2 family protein [Bacteroidales bacterium]|nr:nuclear transport factor 2 family protein [Bacteroidales bacterium]